jgi:hypothetical protein
MTNAMVRTAAFILSIAQERAISLAERTFERWKDRIQHRALVCDDVRDHLRERHVIGEFEERLW